MPQSSVSVLFVTVAKWQQKIEYVLDSNLVKMGTQTKFKFQTYIELSRNVDFVSSREP